MQLYIATENLLFVIIDVLRQFPINQLLDTVFTYLKDPELFVDICRTIFFMVDIAGLRIIPCLILTYDVV